jgi:hypothetical protein
MANYKILATDGGTRWLFSTEKTPNSVFVYDQATEMFSPPLDPAEVMKNAGWKAGSNPPAEVTDELDAVFGLD